MEKRDEEDNLVKKEGKKEKKNEGASKQNPKKEWNRSPGLFRNEVEKRKALEGQSWTLGLDLELELGLFLVGKIGTNKRGMTSDEHL